jgi:hypothetical protein
LHHHFDGVLLAVVPVAVRDLKSGVFVGVPLTDATTPSSENNDEKKRLTQMKRRIINK